ncbi:hypothetical protein A5714_13075 [Mycobacterium sp. E2462]|uniref:hypothetical protein n=1 Tax=Mycobacterium sp. E2462 TaxID=1834133 RepID=UPI0007FB94E3|nr:hypothetical protein [Mycobacterium sp. E2462]OBI14798.1 hypothetical protein A5714_13075 [Mycobacterium sp. E2462]
MRIAALLAVPLLVGACSHTVSGRSAQLPPGPPTSSTPSASTAAAPAPGAPIAQVIAWIEAGKPADPARYHSATRDGTSTALGADTALSAEAGKVSCLTDAAHTGGALLCLVSLTAPPPPPTTAYGDWQGGWVDFDGNTLQVGAARADPGPFLNGNGADLADGASLFFGDYRCRADQAGLFCVNYAHQSAARFSPAGVEPFGCLRPAPAPDGVGVAFSC